MGLVIVVEGVVGRVGSETGDRKGYVVGVGVEGKAKLVGLQTDASPRCVERPAALDGLRVNPGNRRSQVSFSSRNSKLWDLNPRHTRRSLL